MLQPANTVRLWARSGRETRVASGIRNTINQTAGVLSVRFFVLMTLVIPYITDSDIGRVSAGSMPPMRALVAEAINRAC